MLSILIKLTVGISIAASIACASDTVMVVDSSLSMAGNEDKIQIAIKKALQKNVNAIGFGSYVYPIKKAKDYHLNGSTALSLALEHIDKNFPETKFVILTSDGIPNDIKATKIAAKRLKQKNIKICSTFIGSGKIPKILEDISDITFVSNVDSAIAKCSNKRVKQKLMGAAIIKKVDINEFAF